jgi:CMP-N-acetylneuraminic acid synthetase
MLTIISCAKQNSKRLPGKNWKILNGKPLIQYTIDTMKYLQENLKCKYCVITDSYNCATIARENDIPVLWDNMTDKGMDFNRWIHDKLKADDYVLLQPTNPLRNNYKILQWIEYCINNNVRSAFSAYRKDRLNFVMNGNFFYYYFSQLSNDDLVDINSIIFQDDVMLDIDTIEDFEKARAIYENKNNSGILL